MCFAESEKDFKEKIMEEVKKVRQEAVELEKLKIELKARELGIVERLEVLERRMEDYEEREKEGDALYRKASPSRLSRSSGDDATEMSSTDGAAWRIAGSSKAASA